MEEGDKGRFGVYCDWAKRYKSSAKEAGVALPARPKFVWPKVILEWLRECTDGAASERKEQKRKDQKAKHETEGIIVSLEDFIKFVF